MWNPRRGAGGLYIGGAEIRDGDVGGQRDFFFPMRKRNMCVGQRLETIRRWRRNLGAASDVS